MICLLWKCKNFLLSFLPIKTVGARALVVKDRQVLLVKHTYLPGWCTIGGGVGRGESPLEAVQRELLEEACIQCLEAPKLFGIYYNTYEKRDDYIAFYIVEKFTQGQWLKSREIAEIKWFSLTDLPDDVSSSTQKRINEYQKKCPISDKW